MDDPKLTLWLRPIDRSVGWALTRMEIFTDLLSITDISIDLPVLEIGGAWIG